MVVPQEGHRSGPSRSSSQASKAAITRTPASTASHRLAVGRTASPADGPTVRRPPPASVGSILAAEPCLSAGLAGGDEGHLRSVSLRHSVAT